MSKVGIENIFCLKFFFKSINRNRLTQNKVFFTADFYNKIEICLNEKSFFIHGVPKKYTLSIKEKKCRFII